MLEKYTYDGSKKLDLKNVSTKIKKSKLDKASIQEKTRANQIEIQALQDRLYADSREALILEIQARDAAGKDGTIKHVMSGVNPQGVDVYSFKSPTHEELAHDFLWRFNRALPMRGKIAIFNRSYYEDVLIVKVRSLWKNYQVPERMLKGDLIEKGYKQIRGYEDYLYENGYRIIKIFLNVSAEKQKERFLERIDEEEKNWKFSEADLAERALWPDYTKAYEDAINATATKDNPWYVIPADQKWMARYLVSEIILKVLKSINPQYPVLSPDKKAKLADYRKALLQEGTKPDDAGFSASATEVHAADEQIEKE